jgi:hypothetical protein
LAEQSRSGYLAQVSIFYVHIMYGVIVRRPHAQRRRRLRAPWTDGGGDGVMME